MFHPQSLLIRNVDYDTLVGEIQEKTAAGIIKLMEDPSWYVLTGPSHSSINYSFIKAPEIKHASQKEKTNAQLVSEITRRHLVQGQVNLASSENLSVFLGFSSLLDGPSFYRLGSLEPVPRHTLDRKSVV